MTIIRSGDNSVKLSLINFYELLELPSYFFDQEFAFRRSGALKLFEIFWSKICLDKSEERRLFGESLNALKKIRQAQVLAAEVESGKDGPSEVRTRGSLCFVFAVCLPIREKNWKIFFFRILKQKKDVFDSFPVLSFWSFIFFWVLFRVASSILKDRIISLKKNHSSFVLFIKAQAALLIISICSYSLLFYQVPTRTTRWVPSMLY